MRQPKTLPADTSVAQARACFTDDHVHMLLLIESGRLIGTLIRTGLHSDLDGTEHGNTGSDTLLVHHINQGRACLVGKSVYTMSRASISSA